MLCGHCKEGTIFQWELESQRHKSINIMQCGGDGAYWGVTVSKQWPEARSKAAPLETPPSPVRFYEQAVDNLNLGNFDASAVMFRKALESATKIIIPSLSGASLATRITELKEYHLITPALAEWATEVRLGGNEAAHDDEPYSEKDAQYLHKFCENFLSYAFTLPSAASRRATTKLITQV